MKMLYERSAAQVLGSFGTYDSIKALFFLFAREKVKLMSYFKPRFLHKYMSVLSNVVLGFQNVISFYDYQKCQKLCLKK